MIKKRAIIALIITIIAVAATNKYWLFPLPMPVDMDVEGKGNCSIEVQLNKKDNTLFNKIRQEVKEVNLDNTSHLEFKIKDSKHPKKIRLVILNLPINVPFTIKNMNLKNGKFKIRDYERAEVRGAQILSNKNELIIKPNNSVVNITFADKINIFSSINVDIKILIILFVLVYLFAYKLSDYAANFNTVKEKSRVKIIFLSIFFILLFIPMSHISKEKISVRENRTLANFKPLITNTKEINFNFGKNFEEWFNDRFFLRNELIRINNFIRFHLESDIYNERNVYFDKRTHWAFNAGYAAVSSYENEFEEFEVNIKKLNNFCKKNNIKLYILIAPPSPEIYPDEFSAATGIKNIVYNGENFSVWAKKRNMDYIVSPLKELKSQKDEITYTKGDVHWNELGAFISYKKLMNRIKEDFPSLYILNENDFDIVKDVYSQTDFRNYPEKGCLYRELHIGKKYLDTIYSHFIYKDLKNIIELRIGKVTDEDVSYDNSRNKLSVFMIGNSYEENLADFIIPSFQRVYKRRFNVTESKKLQINRFEDDILNHKPDILILTVLSQEIKCFKDLYGE